MPCPILHNRIQGITTTPIPIQGIVILAPTYEITPPQAIRTMPKSRELQLARQKSLHRIAMCSPCPCGHHVDIIFSFDIFNVIRYLPEGGILWICMELARICVQYKA